MAFESLTDRLAGVFKKLRGHGKLTEADIKAAMREVRMALLEADVNYKVAKDFCAKVSERAMGQEVMESLTPAQQVVKIVNEELVALMGGSEAARLNIKNKGQTIIMLCGLQGNGKTTHAAKLAKYFIKQGRRPMLVACDIYRPAAIDQLQVVGKQAGAPVFTLPGAKPPEIAKKALAHAKDYGNDIVILDTAGRLQIDDVLMQELVDIKEAVPVDETLLVVDAMAGQDAVNVAKTFNEKVSIDGIILTKTDGDTRGGAALSVLAVTGKPIKFQGTGEKLDDLDVFHPDRMASRILGMGDVLSLIERAQAGHAAVGVVHAAAVLALIFRALLRDLLTGARQIDPIAGHAGPSLGVGLLHLAEQLLHAVEIVALGRRRSRIGRAALARCARVAGLDLLGRVQPFFVPAHEDAVEVRPLARPGRHDRAVVCLGDGVAAEAHIQPARDVAALGAARRAVLDLQHLQHLLRQFPPRLSAL